MTRLCERPGCSAPAACVYGIDSKRLSVWIEGSVPDEAGSSALGKRAGVLCRRHADSMVVPIGWTLDDRRSAADAEPTVRRALPVQQVTRRRARRDVGGQSEQLELLEVAVDVPATVAPDVAPDVSPAVSPAVVDTEVRTSTDRSAERAEPAPADPTPTAQDPAVPDADGAAEPASLPPASPWRPVFDQTDDLGGLLATRSPLLSRAFGRRDRPTDGEGAGTR